jgi:branched-chain amino acid transport system ATP-binding protein
VGQPLLRVENLSKAFGGILAVQRLSFSVLEGEILGVVGPNGSGKTTAFNLVAGALRPDAGEIYLSGRRITRHPPSARSELGIARTFQLVRIMPGLTVLENVLVAALYGRGRLVGEPRAEAHRLLDHVGLAARSSEPAGALTLGERRRIETARALATRPHLLLLDEPLSGLTAAEVDAMLALFRRIRHEGTTLALVEHNVPAVRTLCDRVLVLSSGRLIAEGHPERVLTQPDVVEVYLGTWGTPHR